MNVNTVPHSQGGVAFMDECHLEKKPTLTSSHSPSPPPALHNQLFASSPWTHVGVNSHVLGVSRHESHSV